MQRVMDGMKLIQPAMYVGYDPAGHGDSDIPYDIHPPGVLWGISVTIVAGRTYTWKIRFGDHRAGGSTEPPNSMVQCYPLGPSFSLSGIEVTGYLIWIYRLDKSGTGIFYGMDPDYIIGPSPQIIDPAWHQIVISTGFFGIPFQDPPPLIGADI